MTSRSLVLSPGAVLRQSLGGELHAGAHLNGFGGLHGGLALGLITASMQAAVAEEATGQALRSVTGRFHRPLDEVFRVTVGPRRGGRRTSVVPAVAEGATGVHVEASAVLGAPHEQAWQAVAPIAPPAPPPADLEIFAVPPEWSPIAAYTEIRPVGPNRPYLGGSEPELTAWIRLVEDDEPPDLHRFVFLMDALAPSYAAVLSTLAPMPTVEFTVRPGAGIASARSPWILVRATTTAADPDGWVEEHIEAWDPPGTFLGSADQLRVVRTLSG